MGGEVSRSNRLRDARHLTPIKTAKEPGEKHRLEPYFDFGGRKIFNSRIHKIYLFMLLVKTKIGQSKIAGIGLFADQLIPKGTPIWKFMPGFDLKVSKDQLQKLSNPSKEQFLKYAYLNPDTSNYILCFDDARFFNHADNPNCIDGNSSDDPEGISVAVRDISVGEELTENYKGFDADFDYKMSIH